MNPRRPAAREYIIISRVIWKTMYINWKFISNFTLQCRTPSDEEVYRCLWKIPPHCEGNVTK